MLDLGNLVLGSNLPLFGQAITVNPVASQPGQPPYEARGAWRSRTVDVVTDETELTVTQVQTLLIRLAEFTVPPCQRDEVTVDGIRYAVSDPLRYDGKGGARMTLKSLTKPAPRP